MRVKDMVQVALVLMVTAALWGCDESGIDEGEGGNGIDQPRWEEPSTAAERVAADVFKAHGGDRWDEVERLRFRFVVARDDERVFEATHDWHVVDATDRVQWRDDEGYQWEVEIDLDTQQVLEASRDGEQIDRADLGDIGERAYRRWINDSYWLLMPIKLFDPGVNLSVEPAQEVQGREVHRLELSFDDVGLTPGDQYDVRVDRDSHEILSWQMDLQGSTDRSEVEWDNYQDVGPLRLPVRRQWVDGTRHIYFEEVSVSTVDDGGA